LENRTSFRADFSREVSSLSPAKLFPGKGARFCPSVLEKNTVEKVDLRKTRAKEDAPINGNLNEE
jgi:hypothetical protein